MATLPRPNNTANTRSKSLILACSGLFLLHGCAAQTGDFPTIAKRPVENLPIDDKPDPARLAQGATGPIKPLPLEKGATIANQLGQARESNNAFARALPATRKSVAAGASAAMGSERWSQAQSNVSALLVMRNRTAAALSAIDTILMDAQRDALADKAMADLTPLIAAQSEIATIVSNQDQEIERLSQQLKAR